MLDKLKALFSAEPEATVDDEASLHMAAAVLMIQVAKSDHQVEAPELARIEQVLRREWGLSDQDLADLMQIADETSEAHVSLHAHVDRVNRHFSASQKCDLVRGLWEVACADGKIHPYEELLVRRLADLIYVPHTDFIRTKHQALAAT